MLAVRANKNNYKTFYLVPVYCSKCFTFFVKINSYNDLLKYVLLVILIDNRNNSFQIKKLRHGAVK